MDKKLITAFILLLFMSSAALAAPESFAPIVKATKDGVVNINVITEVSNPHGNDEMFNWFFGTPQGKYKSQGSGTGFIIDDSGLVITNNHVIDNAVDITVKTSDGKEYKAELIGKDSLSDLALLKITPAKNIKLKVLKLGDSDDIEMGDWVLAVGNPQGLEWTVTAGIVSAKGRNLSSGPYDNFIQTDASINPGNSGGPLLNIKGEVVGINSMIYRSSQGLGFAVPVNMLKDILPQLKSGYVKRGWMGVSLQDINENLAESLNLPDTKGALIAEVQPKSPAEKAGLLPGDVIKAADEKYIEDTRDLVIFVGSKQPKSVVNFTIVRDGKVINKKVTLDEKKSDDYITPQKNIDEQGISVRDLQSNEIQTVGQDGVYILKVKPGSNMEKAGLKAGHVILSVDRKDVKNTKEFHEAYDKVQKGKNVLMKIYISGGIRFIAFTKD